MRYQISNSVPDMAIGEGETLYLMVDGGRIPMLERALLLTDSSADASAVYSYPPWNELREVSPFIVEATPKIVSWFRGLTISGAGYFFSSSLDLLDLTIHFSTLVEAQTPYGSKVLFKMAHPEGTWVLFSDHSPLLWHGISKVWVPLRHGWEEKEQPRPLQSAAEALTFTESQWQAFGQIAWSNTLDKISRHMTKWFPARLSAAEAPRDWVAKWADVAYQKGFATERDLLLFFNVLGYLGEHAVTSPVYPDIYRLIEQPSLLTPSQRIEQAAELAAALA